jgi:hypothetical protein
MVRLGTCSLGKGSIDVIGGSMKLWAFIIFLSTVGTIAVNTLANILPLNNRFTGEISDSIPNLFAPAGLTFAIWGVIYLLLLAFSVYSLTLPGNYSPVKKQIPLQLGPMYFLASLANGLWIFAWHWLEIGISLVLMVILLGSLIYLYLRVREITYDWPRKSFGRLLLRSTFGIYLGWITVATVANITSFLVVSGYDGGPWAQLITLGVLVAVGFIGITHSWTTRDLGYQLVLIWALVGIGIKRLDETIEPLAPMVGYWAIGIAGILGIGWIVATLVHQNRSR